MMHAMLRDLLAAAFGLAGAALWTQFFVLLVRARHLASAISRKAVHVTTGPLFFLTLPLYSTRPGARYLAAAVPALFALRLLLAARGITADGLAEAVARGDSGRDGACSTFKCDKSHRKSRSSSISSVSSSSGGGGDGRNGSSSSSSLCSSRPDRANRESAAGAEDGRRIDDDDSRCDRDMAARKAAAAAAAVAAARREAAGGPFWYAVAVSAATLGGWRTDRAAAVAVAMLAFGDGCAEVGARRPLVRWPLPAGWKRKSVGGSLAFVAAGAVGAVALTGYLAAAGVLAQPPIALPGALRVAAACAVVELLPFEDNILVPLAAYLVTERLG